MSAQYDCLEGTDLVKLINKLDQMAKDGWELVSSHAVAESDRTTHYLFLKLSTPLGDDGNVG